jgi:hypothetical protein
MKVDDRDQRFCFGQASRRIVTCDYSSTRIGGEIVALYSGLLAPDLSSIQNDVNSRAWTLQPWN